jgi:hypothetical protein
MEFNNRFVLYLSLAYDVAGPVAVLLLVRRRTRDWQPAVRWCILSGTAGAFLVGGVAQCLFRWLEGQAGVGWADYWGGGPPPADFVWCFYFLIGGFFGVWFAACGTTAGLVVVAAWRALNPRAFQWFIRQTDRVVVGNQP